jgi:hypothetical protein
MACRTRMNATSVRRPRRPVGTCLSDACSLGSSGTCCSPLGLQSLVPNADECYLAEWWLQGRERLQVDVRPSFDSIVLLVTWSLWKERNARVFRRRASVAPGVAKDLLAEAELWCEAGYKTLAAFTVIWSQNRLAM